MDVYMRIIVKGGRIILLVLSVVGWTVFAMGMVDVISELVRHKNETRVGIPTEKDKNHPDLSKGLLSPLFLFFVSGPVMYVLMGLHILISNENSRHILHSIIMFTNGIYLLAASSTILVTMVFLHKQLGSFVQNASKVPLDERISKKMLGGVSTAVGFYWLSMFLWPLSNMRRKSFIPYQELQHMSHETVVWD